MLFELCDNYIIEANRTNGINANENIYNLCFDYFLRNLTAKEIEKLNIFFNLKK